MSEVERRQAGGTAAAVGRAVSRARWDTASTSCRRCSAEFGLIITREHHCRCCGHKYCDDCSDRQLLLLPADGGALHGEPTRERACMSCYALHVGRAGATVSESVRKATTLPNGAPWRMAWMFADAALVSATGVELIDKALKWTAKHNPARWAGGRFGEGSPPAEVLGMLRRLSAAKGAEAAKPIRLWTQGEEKDRKFSSAGEASAWIEQQAHAICCWISPQSTGGHQVQHPAGAQVRVHGLVKARQHNGKLGKIRQYDDVKGRYQVELLGGGGGADCISVRTENFYVFSEYARLSSDPSSRQGYLPAEEGQRGGFSAAAAAAGSSPGGQTPEPKPEPEPEPEPELPEGRAIYSEWKVGDRALYRRQQQTSAAEPAVAVTVLRVHAPAGEIPSIVVRMPDGGERDTTPARLFTAGGVAMVAEHQTQTPEPLEYGYVWQDVPAGSRVPPGMAYTLPMEGRARQARIPPQWQLQLWSEPADAFYRISVRRTQTVAQVEAVLVAEGPSLPKSMQRDWGLVQLGVQGGGRLDPGLTVESSRLFHLKQDGQLELLGGK